MFLTVQVKLYLSGAADFPRLSGSGSEIVLFFLLLFSDLAI